MPNMPPVAAASRAAAPGFHIRPITMHATITARHANSVGAHLEKEARSLPSLGLPTTTNTARADVLTTAHTPSAG